MSNKKFVILLNDFNEYLVNPHEEPGLGTFEWTRDPNLAYHFSELEARGFVLISEETFVPLNEAVMLHIMKS